MHCGTDADPTETCFRAPPFGLAQADVPVLPIALRHAMPRLGEGMGPMASEEVNPDAYLYLP